MAKLETWLLRSSDVGSANRARVMRLLYIAGPLTRADLAGRLGVSRATVGTVVQPLVDQEVLIELPPRSASESGGKPARPLWFSHQRRLGSIYLSADECAVASVHLDGRIADLTRERVTSADPGDVLDLVRRLSVDLFAGQEIAGVGVAFAGMVDSTDGALLANYRMPSIKKLPLADKLSEACGVPVFVGHHPRVQAFGDAWFGLGRALDSFGSVVTGEVLGLGIVRNGTVVQGSRGSGGEAGHMVIDLNGSRCNCGRRGCWETIATLPWLRAEAAKLGLPPSSVETSRALMAAAEHSERHRELAQRYAQHVGLGLANLEHIMGLGNFIVHGDVATGGETLRQWVEDALVANSPVREPAPHVLVAPEPDEATLLGGAALVLSHQFPPTPTRKPAAPDTLQPAT